MYLCSLLVAMALSVGQPAELAYLHQVAHEVIDSSRVAAGVEIPGVGKNTTGYALRVPGGTQTYYPAFWVRDAAMMLGADLVPADEIEGWIRVVAATQPGPNGLTFPHGLVIPPFSIPDHVTLQGEACWFPGAYANQGVGNYGFLPPADDAFFFIQMIADQARLAGNLDFLRGQIKTAWGSHPLSEVAAKAFGSVDVDPKTGLVVCSEVQGQGRVDWGFCDSVTKTGSCLMPSLLRWQAAGRLALLFDRLTDHRAAREYRSTQRRIAKNLINTLYRPLPNGEGMLLSATGLGKKDDVWASSFAVWLGVLPRWVVASICRHLRSLVESGGIVARGQVRHMPTVGEFGGYWDRASSGKDTYQNGGYWATPTGWLVYALKKIDNLSGNSLLSSYISYVRSNREKGAPFEWINPYTHTVANGNYGSSAGLVYAALARTGLDRR